MTIKQCDSLGVTDAVHRLHINVAMPTMNVPGQDFYVDLANKA